MQPNCHTKRVLAICNVDVMADLIVKPWLASLRASGYEVHVACAPGPRMAYLRRDGFETHVLDIQRRFNPLVNFKAIMQAWKLIRKYDFEIVNTHSPVAAVVGRIAATLAGVPQIIYTVHGFYFHENMPWRMRAPIIAAEWILGRATKHFMFVSEEDRQTALLTGIARETSCTTTIYNAVNSRLFTPPSSFERESSRSSFGFEPEQTVIGIVGRIVKEKGYREFAAMARSLLRVNSNVRFMVVGDSLSSDRDRFGAEFREKIDSEGMSNRFTFAGFTNDVPRYLRALDIFVLPSYREGFPRSVLEAMASGLPVVTTNIRGCREAVVQGETGLIVPPGNADALAVAVSYLVQNPEIAQAMGAAGRRRTIEVFDESVIHKRFVGVFNDLSAALVRRPARRRASVSNVFLTYLSRAIKSVLDFSISASALILLSPILIILALLVHRRMGSPALFRQSRPGLNERPFIMLKFRTMRDAYDANGQPLSDTERLTGFGDFLRRTSLDELPELWNVLTGDMSLIGPRPLLPEYLPRYSEFQKRRHNVKSGITGWAQVNGRNGLSWEEKFRLDVWYVDNWSLLLDLKILWRTLATVWTGDGIAEEGQVSMSKFMGSAPGASK